MRMLLSRLRSMRPIAISKHACDRMRERFPTIRNPEGTAQREVTAGILEGRRSKTKPDWASTYERIKGRHSTRFVWNANLSRCYVTTEKRIRGMSGMLVVTVLPRGKPETLGLMSLVVPERSSGPHAPKSWRRPRTEDQ